MLVATQATVAHSATSAIASPSGRATELSLALTVVGISKTANAMASEIRSAAGPHSAGAGVAPSSMVGVTGAVPDATLCDHCEADVEEHQQADRRQHRRHRGQKPRRQRTHQDGRHRDGGDGHCGPRPVGNRHVRAAHPGQRHRGDALGGVGADQHVRDELNDPDGPRGRRAGHRCDEVGRRSRLRCVRVQAVQRPDHRDREQGEQERAGPVENVADDHRQRQPRRLPRR